MAPCGPRETERGQSTPAERGVGGEEDLASGSPKPWGANPEGLARPSSECGFALCVACELLRGPCAQDLKRAESAPPRERPSFPLNPRAAQTHKRHTASATTPPICAHSSAPARRTHARAHLRRQHSRTRHLLHTALRVASARSLTRHAQHLRHSDTDCEAPSPPLRRRRLSPRLSQHSPHISAAVCVQQSQGSSVA